MKTARKILRFLDGTFTAVMLLLLFLLGAYAGYALWDNHQVYSRVELQQSELLELKPTAPEQDEEAEPQPINFDHLLKINPDTLGWLSVGNTKIDYPLVQGQNNLYYVNTDFYGQTSLAGAIFLDTRCSGEMQSGYQLLYGHHMSNGLMFGDLDQFEDLRFFQENRTGELLTPEGAFSLEIFAFMMTEASDSYIFNPANAEKDLPRLMAYIRENATHFREGDLEDDEENLRLLAMTTCTGDYTDERIVVLAYMK